MQRPPPIHFYMDDSGTRTPDRAPTRFVPGSPDHFALGGVLVRGEDEDQVRSAHRRLCDTWGINYALHSVDIRAGANDFAWVTRDSDDYEPFMRDLTHLLTTIPVLGLACVIDRPGYDHRYRRQYGRRQWHLCHTAFTIAVERAAKYARSMGRALRVYPEQSAKKDERRIRRYYRDMCAEGLPFNPERSGVYRPLHAHECGETLIELRFKAKTSPPMQIADLYLWPIARKAYGQAERPYRAFYDAGRLMECHLTQEEIPRRGTKYYCFELVRRAAG
jgi:Protein of unknown function (DUF3800)